MKSSILSRFLTRWVRRRPIRKASPIYRPQLEQLEERCCPSAYSAVVLANAPVAYFRLGETAGTIMADSSGNPPANGGTYAGIYSSAVGSGPVTSTAGAIYGDTNTAIALDGKSGYAQIGTSNPFDPFVYPFSGNESTSQISFETWFKSSQVSTFNGNYGNSFSSDALAQAANWAATTGGLHTVNTWQDPTGTKNTFNLGTPNVQNSVQMNGQSIYIPVAQQAAAANLDFLAFNAGGNAANLTFTIHYADTTTQTVTQSFTNWTTALSSTNYAGESAAATAYLDHNGGANYNGSHINGYSFALTGGTSGTSPVTSITLPNNGNISLVALNLSGGGISTPINLTKAGNAAGTASAFGLVGINSDAASFVGGVILGQTATGSVPGQPNSGGTAFAGWVPAIYMDEAGHIRASLLNHNNGNDQIISPTPLNDGNWHYIVDSYNQGVETLYIDGVAVGSMDFPQYGYSASGYDYYLGTGYTINYPSTGFAQTFTANNGWGFLKGSLDEAAIYESALTAAQVQTHYLTGIGHVSNLAITDVASPTTQAAGGNVQYTITVTNNAGLTENGITVADPFIAAEYSASPWTATYTGVGSSGPASGTGSINTAINLAAGGTATFIVNATLSASAANPTKNTATATAPGMTPTTLTVVPGYQENALSWNTTTLPATYNVYRGTSSGGETLLASGVTGTSYVDSDTSGATYYYEVTAVYPYTPGPGNYESPTSNEASGTPSTGALVSGLTTQYYTDQPGNPPGGGNFAADAAKAWLSPNQVGSAVIEPFVNNNDFTSNVNWGGTPNNPNYMPTAITSANGGANNFSVKWTGFLEVPATGTYNFGTASDDGSYLFLNGKEIVNNGYYQGVTLRTSGGISLSAGQIIPIEMDYYQGGGGAAAFLEWVTPSGGPMAVIPAADLFTASLVPPVPVSASFVNLDTTTHGNWIGKYGANGYYLSQGPVSLPADTSVGIAGANFNGWNQTNLPPTGSNYAGALQNFGTVNHIASCWYTNGPGSSYTINVDFTDGQPHQVAIYALDWDSTVRTAGIQVVDATTGTVLDTENASALAYHNGEYFVWNVTGNVNFIITSPPGNPGGNATISGIFFGGSSPPFSFWSPEAVTANANVIVTYLPTTLSVSKTAAPTVTAGKDLTYAITVTNTGSNPAYYVDLKDILPAGELFVSDVQVDGPTFKQTDPAVGANGTINDVLPDNVSLAPGQSADFYWTVQVAPSVPAGSISNTVTATTDPSQWAGSATSTVSTTVNTSAVLTVTKTAANIAGIPAGSVVPGDYLIYTVTIANTGPSDAQNVTLSDPLPANETFVSAVQNSGPTFTPSTSPTAIDEGIATLAFGKSATFTWTVLVGLSPTSGTIKNIVTAATSDGPNATAEADTTIVTTPPNLLVTKTGPATVTPGGTITYTVTIDNTGNNNAQNVVLNDPLPAGETVVSDTYPVPFTSNTVVGSTTFNETVGTLFPNKVYTFTWVVKVGSGVTVPSTLKNIVTASASNRNPYTAEADTTVTYPPTTITVAKTGPAGPIVASSTAQVTYNLGITNSGATNPAYGMTLSDPLPAGETVASFTEPAVGWSENTTLAGGIYTVTFTSPSGSNPLAAGATANFTITANVPANVPAGTLSNTATANAVNLSTAGNVKSPTVSTTVTNSAALGLVKTESAGPYYAGNTLTYNLVLTNSNAGSDAFGASVSDPLPAGTTLNSFTPVAGWTESFSGGAIKFSNPDFAAGGTATFAFVVNVPSNTATGTKLSNIASALATDAPSVNSNTVTATVGNLTSLALTKTETAGSVYAGNTLTYNLTLTNGGPSDAFGAVVSDPLPAGTTLGSFTAPGWTESVTAGVVYFKNADFAASGTANFALVVNVPASMASGTVLTNKASALATGASSVSSGTVTATVNTLAKLVVTKTAPAFATPGSSFSYTITIDNSGPSNDTGVVLTDALPPGLTFSSFGAAPANWTQTNSAGTLTFTDGSPLVVSGTATTFTVNVMVPAATANGTSFTNTVTAVSNTTPLNPASVLTASAMTTAETVANLQVTKTAPAAVTPGTGYTYTITIDNSGPSPAQSVVLADALPAGLTFGSFGAAPAGWTQTNSAGNITFTDGSPLAVSGTPTTFTFTVTVPIGTANGTVFTNTVNATTTTTLDPASVTKATVTTTATVVADLQVTKTGPATVTAGNQITYTIGITNNGPSPAANVVLTDPLPAGETFASETDPGAPWSETNPGAGKPGTVTFSDATLAVGGTATFTIVVNVPSSTLPGTLSNTVTATTSTATDASSTLKATANTTVSAQANLVVTKTAAPFVLPGAQITYNISVTNNGPSDAQGVVLTDPIPPTPNGTWGNLTFASQTNPGGTWTETDPGAGNPGTVTFSDPTLAAGATANFTIVVNVPAGTPYKVVFSNTITAKETTAYDPTKSTLSATAVVTTNNFAFLTLVKGGPTTAAPGQTFYYTLTLTNSGPNPAVNTVITDALPAGTTLISVGLPLGWTETGPSKGFNGTVTFSDANFAKGSANFSIGVTTSSVLFTSATLKNTAAVTADDSQLAPAPIFSNTITTTITPTPNAQFVYNVYVKLLGRAPDAGGGSYWVSQLNAGLPPSTFVADIEASPEYLSDQVTAMYQQYLGHAPDAGGLQYWVGQLEGGATLEQVAAGLLSSPEYFADQGTNNTAFVQALYQSVLGRPADGPGLAYWVAFLNNGEVRNGGNPAIAASLRYQVAMALLTSTEYQGDLINKDYQTYLYRPADLNGLISWEQAMQAGLSDQAVLAAIFGSAEGYAKNS